jgi:hypothetical protein
MGSSAGTGVRRNAGLGLRGPLDEHLALRAVDAEHPGDVDPHLLAVVLDVAHADSAAPSDQRHPVSPRNRIRSRASGLRCSALEQGPNSTTVVPLGRLLGPLRQVGLEAGVVGSTRRRDFARP